jgi:hypothetical protein
MRPTLRPREPESAMARKPRYPQSRPATTVAALFLAALVGIAVPASVGGLFEAYAPHVGEASDN